MDGMRIYLPCHVRSRMKLANKWAECDLPLLDKPGIESSEGHMSDRLRHGHMDKKRPRCHHPYKFGKEALPAVDSTLPE